MCSNFSHPLPWTYASLLCQTSPPRGWLYSNYPNCTTLEWESQRQLTASINWVCLRKMWMWGHFNQSGYEEESAGQNVFMGMKCHDHVSKEVGKRKKKPPSSFDFVCLFFKTNHRSNQLEAKKFQSQLSRTWSSCCYHSPASRREHRRSWGESARVRHLTMGRGIALLCV